MHECDHLCHVPILNAGELCISRLVDDLMHVARACRVTMLKSAFQGPKSGHRGVGEATLGTVSGSGLSKYGQNEVKLLHRNL